MAAKNRSLTDRWTAALRRVSDVGESYVLCGQKCKQLNIDFTQTPDPDRQILGELFHVPHRKQLRRARHDETIGPDKAGETYGIDASGTNGEEEEWRRP